MRWVGGCAHLGYRAPEVLGGLGGLPASLTDGVEQPADETQVRDGHLSHGRRHRSGARASKRRVARKPSNPTLRDVGTDATRCRRAACDASSKDKTVRVFTRARIPRRAHADGALDTARAQPGSW